MDDTILQEYENEFHCQFTEKTFAEQLDSVDPLREFRTKFHYPTMQQLPDVDLNIVDVNSESIYFCGNSLGLQPKGVQHYINEQLQKWAHMGVHGHFLGNLPWALCDEYLEEDMAKVVGAQVGEVVLMNGLTVNLHLLLMSFYKPSGERRRILCESQAFPSDHYAFESHARLHGLDPQDVLLCVKPREGESCLRLEDIEKVIREEGHTISVICFSGVHYYTGQYFNIPAITQLGREYGCIVGWDLAHAVANVELHLHEWNVDFACWCTYKYLNSGAGGIAGIFIHNRIDSSALFKLHGWWSHRYCTRYDMTNRMEETSGASSYRISNPPILLCCSLRACLDVFQEAGGMKPIREKSILLTGYLEKLIHHYWKVRKHDNDDGGIQILTPTDLNGRGAQLSFKFSSNSSDLLKDLYSHGVACDLRKPDVIRVAPVPLYNSFLDVWRFVEVLKKICPPQ